MTDHIHKLHTHYKNASRVNLVNSARNFMEFVSICAIIILSAAIFQFSSRIKNQYVSKQSYAQTTGTTGAINTPLTAQELKQIDLSTALFKSLPIVKNTYVIDFDYSTNTFRVVLTDPYSTARSNFDTWKLNNYPDLDIGRFSFYQFRPASSATYLLTVIPYYSDVGRDITFTTVYFDNNGSTDIDSVYFGFSKCSIAQAAANGSEFERRFSNFFAAKFIPGTNTGSIANKNPSSGCSNTIGSLPWTDFSNASSINLTNYPANAKLLTVTKTGYGKILKVSWKVNLSSGFVPPNVISTYYYYYMAKDKSGLWNTGTTTPKWTYSGRVNYKVPVSTVTPTPSPRPTAAVTVTPTPRPTVTPTPVSGTIDIIPTNDAYVTASYPGTNFGSANTLQVDGSPVKVIYMKFDLTGLAGKTITKAVLRFLPSDSSSSTQNIKRVSTNSWSESTITYNSRPSLGTAITSFGSSSAGSYKEINITTFVNNNKGTVVTIALDSAGSDGLDFYSSEYSTSSSRPRIRVQ